MFILCPSSCMFVCMCEFPSFLLLFQIKQLPKLTKNPLLHALTIDKENEMLLRCSYYSYQGNHLLIYNVPTLSEA